MYNKFTLKIVRIIIILTPILLLLCCTSLAIYTYAAYLDQNKIREVEGSVKYYFVDNGELPASAPQINVIYEYKPLAYSRYEVCMNFAVSTKINLVKFLSAKMLDTPVYPHAGGNQCIELNIDSKTLEVVRKAEHLSLKNRETPLFIVEKPADGDILSNGSVYTIKWTFNPNSALSYNRTQIAIEDVGIEPITKEVYSKPGANEYQWVVKGRGLSSVDKNNRIMISLYDEYYPEDELGFDFAAYSKTFTIKEPGAVISTTPVSKTQLEVYFPAGGEKFINGKTISVHFSFNENNAAPPHAMVSVDLYKGDKQIGTIAKGMAAFDGKRSAFDWTPGIFEFEETIHLEPGDDYRLKAYGVIVESVKNWKDPLPVIPGVEFFTPYFSIVNGN